MGIGDRLGKILMSLTSQMKDDMYRGLPLFRRTEDGEMLKSIFNLFKYKMRS
jgi:hypothetical protein